MRAWLCALTAVLASVLVAPVATPPASAAAPVRMDLERLPPKVFPGSPVWLEGQISGPRRPRAYVVQRRLRDGSWVQVRRDSTQTGFLYTRVRAPKAAGPVTWRLVAPAVRRNGVLLRRLVSPPRTTKVVVQQVRVSAPATVEVGSVVRMRVQLTPYVRGQSVVVKQVVNGQAQRVTDGFVPPEGGRFSFTQVTTGPATYRIVASGGTVTRVVRGTPASTVLPTRRVSTTGDGSQLSGGSGQASASDDGRWIAFVTGSDNAVRGDTNKRADVFLKDTVTGTLRRISHGPKGVQSDGVSSDPAVAGGGYVVAFVSRARTLVAGDRNGRPDVFVWRRSDDTVTRVGLDASQPVVSADGLHVAFTATAEGTSGVFVRDLRTGTLTRVSPATDASSAPAISDDGGLVAYTGPDGVRLWSRATGTTELVAAGGHDARLDADGSLVAYLAPAGERTGAYALDRSDGEVTVLATDQASPPEEDVVPLVRVDSVTADGSEVLITTNADLVEDDEDTLVCESEPECYYRDYKTDAFVVDVATGAVDLVSRSATGEVTDLFAEGFDLLADGSGVVFGSRDVLVPGQRSRDWYYSPYAWPEVFVRDLD